MTAHDTAGAYGLSVSGVAVEAGLVAPVPDHWPAIRVSQADEPAPSATDGTSVTRLIGGGQLAVNRLERVATIHRSPRLGDDALVHPYLAPIAARFAVVEQSVPFHAGGYVHDGGTWLVVGGRESGKSSLMAALAGRRVPVVADDLVVVRDGTVMAGPRTLDLRADVAALLGGATRILDAGLRERWRLRLAPIAPELAPVAGVVQLAWGNDVRIEPTLDAAMRMQTLLSALSNSSKINVPSVMQLAARPAFTLTRPRDWAATDSAIDTLLGVA